MVLKLKADKSSLEDYKPKNRLFGQHGNGVSIALDVVTFPAKGRMWYELTVRKRIVFAGPNIDEAIDLYNKYLALE